MTVAHPVPGPYFEAYELLGRLVADAPTPLTTVEVRRLVSWLREAVASEDDNRQLILGRATYLGFRAAGTTRPDVDDGSAAPAPPAAEVAEWTLSASPRTGGGPGSTSTTS